MKLSQKLLMDVPSLPPSLSLSKFIGNVYVLLDSRKRLGGHVESWHDSWCQILMKLPPIWHHLKVHQDCPCPPKLQEENWRTGGVLTWFLMSDYYETFTDSSDGCSLLSDPISRSIRNNHLLLDFRKRLGGQGKTWNDSWCQILIKFPIKTKLLPKPLV